MNSRSAGYLAGYLQKQAELPPPAAGAAFTPEERKAYAAKQRPTVHALKQGEPPPPNQPEGIGGFRWDLGGALKNVGETFGMQVPEVYQGAASMLGNTMVGMALPGQLAGPGVEGSGKKHDYYLNNVSGYRDYVQSLRNFTPQQSQYTSPLWRTGLGLYDKLTGKPYSAVATAGTAPPTWDEYNQTLIYNKLPDEAPGTPREKQVGVGGLPLTKQEAARQAEEKAMEAFNRGDPSRLKRLVETNPIARARRDKMMADIKKKIGYGAGALGLGAMVLVPWLMRSKQPTSDEQLAALVKKIQQADAPQAFRLSEGG